MASLRAYKGISPSIGKKVYLDASVVIVGDVVIGDDSSVWPFVSMRGDVNSIRIGDRTSIQDNAVLHVTHKSTFLPEGWPLIIGNDVTIGHKATLHGCTVGNRVLVGIDAIILDGAVVEDDVMIGAGTLVPPGKKLESGYLYVGSPCKQTRKLSATEIERLVYSAKNYVNVKNTYLAEEKN
ncbi:gamma carbonic anhydrase family protein [Aurantivibrio infirmus]